MALPAFSMEARFDTKNFVQYINSQDGGLSLGVDVVVLHTLKDADKQDTAWSVLLGGHVSYPKSNNKAIYPWGGSVGARYFGIPFGERIKPYFIGFMGYSQGNFQCIGKPERSEAIEDNNNDQKGIKMTCHYGYVNVDVRAGVHFELTKTFYVFLEDNLFVIYPWRVNEHPQDGVTTQVAIFSREGPVLSSLRLGLGVVF